MKVSDTYLSYANMRAKSLLMEEKETEVVSDVDLEALRKELL